MDSDCVSVAWTSNSSWVRAAERGDPPPFGALEPSIRATLTTLHDELDAWANRSVGADLAEQVDPDFIPGPAMLSSVPVT